MGFSDLELWMTSMFGESKRHVSAIRHFSNFGEVMNYWFSRMITAWVLIISLVNFWGIGILAAYVR